MTKLLKLTYTDAYMTRKALVLPIGKISGWGTSKNSSGAINGDSPGSTTASIYCDGQVFYTDYTVDEITAKYQQALNETNPDAKHEVAP